MKTVYLDCASTTKVRKEVISEMNKFNSEIYGNPSSLHFLGEKARKAIDEARIKIAKEINAKTSEIIFTSGATESNNLAIKGILGKDQELIISTIEHPSVWEVAKEVRIKNPVKVIQVDSEGAIDLSVLEKLIGAKTKLISIIHANNVFGTIQDLDKIGSLCRKKGILFHTDASQSFGKIKIDVKKSNISLLSGSAHKIGGPKGIGFLYIREGLSINPEILGGGQERNIRSGTENVSGIVGFAKALDLQRKVDPRKIEKIRDYFMIELEKIGKVNGSKIRRLHNNIHASFPGVSGQSLVFWLSKKGICISSGSACDSKREKEDYVLKAIGLSKEEADSSIRISIDENVSLEDAKKTVFEIRKALDVLKRE